MLLLLNYVSTPSAAGVVGLALGLTSQADDTVAWTAQTTLDGAAVAADAAPGYTLLNTSGAVVASGQMMALPAVGWYYGAATGLVDRGHLLRVAALISDTEAVGVAAVQNTIELAAAATIADAVRLELAAELALIDAAVSSRATQASVDDVPTVVEFEARTLPAADYTVVSDLGTVQTGDAYARLGAPAGASVSADIADIENTSTTLLATLAAVKAKTDLISTAGAVTVVSPVASGGEASVYQGDDYHNTDGRALAWSSDAWPDLTGAAIALLVKAPDGTVLFSVAGAAVDPGSATQTARVELTAAQTATLAAWPGPSALRVRATLASGRIVTLVDSTLEAIEELA